MSVYFVVNSSIDNPELLDSYLEGVGPSLDLVPLKILAVDTESATIEGEPAGPRTVILEFEHEGDFRTWYDSAEYQAVVGQRHAATTGFGVLVTGR